MPKKRGLGKGLDVLFGEATVGQEQNESAGALKVEVSRIDNNPNQPRKNFDDETLAALAQSIAERGVLQPLILRETGDRYEIVAGERRWRAAMKAGLKEVPATIVDCSDAEATQIALVENLQREDLNPIEEAAGYEDLINSYGLTQEQVAQRVGKSRSAVTNALRLMSLPDEIKESLISGRLSAGHARALLPLGQGAINLWQEIIKKDLSVRETEKLVKNELERGMGKEKKAKETVGPDYYKDVEKQIEYALGRKVRVTGNGKKGKVEIEYYDYDDLDELIKILTFKK